MSKVYENCVVAFLDILGFKEGLKDHNNAEKLLTLLKRIKEAETTQCLAPVTKNGNVIEIKIMPTITAASDFVVVSVPYEKLGENFGLCSAVISFVDIARWLSFLLLDSGFLLRGGITFGQLYHANGLIFGQAFVNAYELECAAKYPRILASPSLVEHFDKEKTGVTYPAFAKDCNGEHYLDYGKAAFNSSPKLIPEIESIILSKLDEHKDNPVILKKWQWYYAYFLNSLNKNWEIKL